MNTIFCPEFIAFLDDIIADAQRTIKTAAPKNLESSSIPISRVIYSGNATTVFFTDGTKTTVMCSTNDKYDRQTALAYALVKKAYGKVGRYDKNGVYHPNEIDGNGIGLKLEKIAASGYDQDAEEKIAKEKKATAKADHLARQKAQHETAWERKVRARAEEIRLEREANALLDRENSLKKTNSKKPLNESCSTMSAADFFGNNDPAQTIKANPLPNGTSFTSGLLQIDPKDAWKLYRRPNKPFSKFTDAEKRGLP